MFNKINTIIALTLLMAFLFPISEIVLSQDRFNHFPIYQTLLFIFPYLLLSVVIFKKYEKIYNLNSSKSIFVLFAIGNILIIEYFFRLDLIKLPIIIIMKITSITMAILSYGYAERQIIGFIGVSLLLLSIFIYIFNLTKKENALEEDKI